MSGMNVTGLHGVSVSYGPARRSSRRASAGEKPSGGLPADSHDSWMNFKDWRCASVTTAAGTFNSAETAWPYKEFKASTHQQQPRPHGPIAALSRETVPGKRCRSSKGAARAGRRAARDEFGLHLPCVQVKERGHPLHRSPSFLLASLALLPRYPEVLRETGLLLRLGPGVVE